MGFLESIKNWLLDFDNKQVFNASQDFNVVIVGLVLVIAALFLLSMIISAFPYIFRGKSEKKIKSGEAGSIDIIDGADGPTAVYSAHKPVDIEDSPYDDEELIAVLTAAVSAYYSNSTNCNLRIASYKRTENRSPAWNNAGKADNLNASL